MIPTQGLACPCPDCDYFAVTDYKKYALVGNGKRGKNKNIQHLRCQACLTDFSVRRGTPLYYLKTDPSRVEMVLWLLAEGVDVSVMVRFSGHAEATVSRWLEHAGQHSIRLHNLLFVGLHLTLIQLDELHTKVRTIKQALWLWLAIDPITKIIPSLHLGRRRNQDAYALLHDLKLRLAANCVPAFTSDGLRAYFYALTAHFGSWSRPPRAHKDHWRVDSRLLYGQLIKLHRCRKLARTITRMLYGQRWQLSAILKAHGFSSTIQTAFIERVNLTIRQGVAALTRRTWSLAQSKQHLLLHAQWWRAYYHFARPHQSLQLKLPGLKRRYRQRSPAMVSGSAPDRSPSVHSDLPFSLSGLTAFACAMPPCLTSKCRCG